jgi:hypothetical protein
MTLFIHSRVMAVLSHSLLLVFLLRVKVEHHIHMQ